MVAGDVVAAPQGRAGAHGDRLLSDVKVRHATEPALQDEVFLTRGRPGVPLRRWATTGSCRKVTEVASHDKPVFGESSLEV